MAARRQPAPAATPAGLKIKLKGGAAVKACKGSQPQESGEDVGAEPGDGPGTTEGMLKRKRPTPPASPTPSKRPPREESPVPLAANGEPVEVLPGKSETIVADLNVVKQRVGQPHTSVGAVLQAEQAVQVGADRDSEEAKKATPSLENISHGQLQGNPAAPADQHGVSSAGKRACADPSESAEQSQLVATGAQASVSLACPNSRTPDGAEREHTIPSHAGWFSWTKIHTLEKRGLPEFFHGKTPGKTPELYMEYRNVIIKKYREDMEKIITVADVQEQLSAGDDKTISRVLEFLDHWGLINYQASAEFLPVWKGPASALEADVAGMLRALPQKGSSLYHLDMPRASVPKQNLANPRSVDPVISEMLAFPEGPEVEYHCNSCAADCSKQRYHCQKQADFDLCPNCYNDGKFGPDMVSTDFMRMDVTEAANANGGGWTDQETLLLLEALELYGDNWNEIAEHVATKSKSQCILHFIRLPVEDPFLEDMETSGTSLSAPTPPPQPQTDSTAQGEPKGEEITDQAPESSIANKPSTDAAVETSNGAVVLPQSLVAFADAGNPVMAQVAFLAAMVGPRVAAAAAQAALAALTEKDPGPRLAAGTAIILDEPVAEVQRPTSAPHPDRLVQTDADSQSGGVAQPSNAEPGSTGGVAVPVSESYASAQNDDDGHSQFDAKLGKEIVQKIEDDGKFNILEEAINAGHVKQAAASAMAAAAVKAKLLADQEEREMQRLVTTVIEHQLKKLELKLKTFSELEAMLAMECDSVERARQKIYGEHARMVATRLGTSSSPNPPTPLPGKQTPATAQRSDGFTFGPGGQATLIPGPHPSGASSSSQGPTPTGSAPSPAFQGLARPATAGAMSTPQAQFPQGQFPQGQFPQGQYPQGQFPPGQFPQHQFPPGQFLRQPMVGGATHPQSLGRPVLPQGLTPPPQVLGRPLIPGSSMSAQGLGRPLTAPPGMSRPAPGGTSGGMQ